MPARFDYETELRLARLSWDGAHWGVSGKEFGVEPLWQYLVDVTLFAVIIGWRRRTSE